MLHNLQENYDTFIDTNVYSSDSKDYDDEEDNKQISEIKREIEEQKKQIEKQSDTKRTTRRSNVSKSTQEIQGFVVDAENRFQCLDCGKKFTKLCTYTQHSRL